MEDPDLQVVGTIIVVDMAEFSLLQQARLVSPSLAWHLTMAIQVRTAYTQDLHIGWCEFSEDSVPYNHNIDCFWIQKLHGKTQYYSYVNK